jgi:hypothetical protein
MGGLGLTAKESLEFAAVGRKQSRASMRCKFVPLERGEGPETVCIEHRWSGTLSPKELHQLHNLWSAAESGAARERIGPFCPGGQRGER